MYLIRYNEYKIRQVWEIRTDSHFYGWVLDSGISIYRYREGRFEQMRIVQRQREGSKCLFFAAEWHDVVEEKYDETRPPEGE